MRIKNASKASPLLLPASDRRPRQPGHYRRSGTAEEIDRCIESLRPKLRNQSPLFPEALSQGELFVLVSIDHDQPINRRMVQQNFITDGIDDDGQFRLRALRLQKMQHRRDKNHIPQRPESNDQDFHQVNPTLNGIKDLSSFLMIFFLDQL